MGKVYFLGAGATKAVAANAPQNKDLLTAAFFEASNFVIIKKEIETVKKFIEVVFHRNKTEYPLPEDILGFLDYNIRNKTAIRLYGYDDLVHVRNCIVKIICNVLKKNLSNLDFPEATRNFVRKLAPDDVVISTNYDIVIDNALLQEFANVNYGIELRAAIRPYEYVVSGTRAMRDNSIHVNKGDIKLLKIHGALNWLFCSRCDEVDLTAGVKGAADYLDSNLKIGCLNSNCTQSYEPLLVTPSKFKIYENRILKETWRMAGDAITKASELIFIGYSLPEADIEIRCMILNALNRRVEKPNIILIDKVGGNDEVTRRYRSLFGGKVRPMSCGFVDYVSNLSGYSEIL